MTKIPIFQVDAFADKVFWKSFAVCPIMQELDESQMQHILAENNLSETAFIKIDTEPYSIRWFTPTIEVDLCGHATLSATSVLLKSM